MTPGELLRRDEILRERDRLKPLLDRAYAMTEDEIVDLENNKGDPVASRERLVKAVNPEINFNPLSYPTDFERSNPHYHLFKLMRNPDYFGFTCRVLLGIELEMFQQAALKILWTKAMPMFVCTRGGGKSFLMGGVYAVLRLLFTQGCRVAMIGGGFRHSKVLFDYAERTWANAVMLRDLLSSSKGYKNKANGPYKEVDRCDLIIGQSMASAFPIGHDGSKIRGQRAQYILADEFKDVNEEIFNNVVFGFAAVSADPVRAAREHRHSRILQAMDLWDKSDQENADRKADSNQVVLAGTADYAFGHFAKTYRLYRNIIYSRGNEHRLKELFGGTIPPGLNWKDYAVIRLPATLLPPRYMDAKIIGAAKAKLTRSQYLREYDSVFPDDSDGFFKRTLIDYCVVGRSKNPVFKPSSDEEINFSPAMRGDPGVRHVIAMDPASEKDKLAIVVVAMHADHRRIVYVWTTDRKAHEEKKSQGFVKETDYYRFVVRKVRELMRDFPTTRIMCDGQGGGVAVREAFHSAVEPGEEPIYQVKDPPDTANPKPSDFKVGSHILEMVQFSKADWVAEANHGLKFDLERQLILFPYWDEGMEDTALTADKIEGRVMIDQESGREVHVSDTLLDCVDDIEKLKDELTSIVHTRTASGRDRWDLPTLKTESGKIGRQRKDRYSSLLMANMGARIIMNTKSPDEFKPVGGVARPAPKREGAVGPFYINRPDWLPETPPPNLGVVRRK
jgi:hypothetical protein